MLTAIWPRGKFQDFLTSWHSKAWKKSIWATKRKQTTQSSVIIQVGQWGYPYQVKTLSTRRVQYNYPISMAQPTCFDAAHRIKSMRWKFKLFSVACLPWQSSSETSECLLNTMFPIKRVSLKVRKTHLEKIHVRFQHSKWNTRDATMTNNTFLDVASSDGSRW